jgi:hypothetical protein
LRFEPDPIVAVAVLAFLMVRHSRRRDAEREAMKVT